jgi:hypothetical protein
LADDLQGSEKVNGVQEDGPPGKQEIGLPLSELKPPALAGRHNDNANVF